MSEEDKQKWCRPADVRARYSIKPGKLATLISRGEVVSVSLAAQDQRKGARLIQVDSIENYLSRLVSDQCPACHSATH